MRHVLAVVVLAGLMQNSLPQVDVRHAARALAPGELVLLTIDPNGEAGAVHVRAFDRDWLAYRSGNRAWQALVGIDLTTAPGDYPVSVRVDAATGVRRGGLTLQIAARTFPVRTLTVDPAFVDPPASAQARIAREREELASLWRTLTPAPRWAGAFLKPVPHAANSAFGARSTFNGEPRSQHTGADFNSPPQTPVQAPAGGRVLLAGDLYFTGGTVMLDHGAGVISLFAHLSAIDVAKGADVRAGDRLGRVGATGRVTGPHLHWTVRVQGVSVDPLSLLHLLGEPR
jgi:murein DD-endopeptidase MepM/ murein hydrolase activator NlpD